MKTVDIRDFDANSGRLIDEAEKGKPFTISADGKPLVKVSRISQRELDQLPAADDDSTGEEKRAGASLAKSGASTQARHTREWAPGLQQRRAS